MKRYLASHSFKYKCKLVRSHQPVNPRLREENGSQLLIIAINKPRGTKPAAETGWAKSAHLKHHLKREERCEDVVKHSSPMAREVLTRIPRSSQCG